MRANAVASAEANMSELAFIRAKRGAPGGSWFNIAKMLGRSEADVRRVYGFIDQLPMPEDFDPRVTHGVPSEDADGDDASAMRAICTLPARLHALRALGREPITADALAALTGWSQDGARRALLRLRERRFAVQSHSGIWSITQAGRQALADMEIIR